MSRLLALLLALGLLTGPDAWAATEVVEYGTPVVFTNSGGTVTFTITNLANAAGRISARHDLGTSHSPTALLKCTFQGVATMTVGNMFEVYTAWSDGANPDGELGTVDAALTTEKRRNLKLELLVEVDQTATDTNMTASREIRTPSQYLQLGAWNASGVATEAGTGTSKCTLTPLLRKIQ